MSGSDDMTGREVRTTRVISASRERVFAAWTDPELLARWWGPKGFTSTFHRFELKPAGTWEFTMHGPNAMDFNNTCIFKRIEPPSYLEFDHLKEMHYYKAMVTFTEVPEGTRILWTIRFDTAEELNPIKDFIAKANEENMDKLELILEPVRAGNFPPQP
ncbi:MAG: SRPBCC family protein [Flavobacteriales bacterium]|nr:SRPBCC family protein [Flavobacteriales bacterium]